MNDWQRDSWHFDADRRPDASDADAPEQGPTEPGPESASGSPTAGHGGSPRAGTRPAVGPRRATAGRVTSAGAQWLVSADPAPHRLLARWSRHPTAPGVLPRGTAFDVINVPAVFGRRMLDRLWSEGPGTGPVSVHRSRMLIFAATGTARRLPELLGGAARSRAVPPLLFHGAGDAVAVPPPAGPPRNAGPEWTERGISRWLVAPEVRHPWLPGPEILLRAVVHAARSYCAGADERGGAAESALAPG
ncbi:hypothetical protein [Streptomyces sp. bgisy100]|uniref:hypothetical protein n=1 Tax=Streptomyces sp. bgisy100 TaxID=3413783 RepID=UPI003D73A253